MLSSRAIFHLSTRGIHARRSALIRPRNATLADSLFARHYHSLSSNSNSLLGGLSTAFSNLDNDDPSFSLSHQVRWKRHSGASEAPKKRRPSKKQMQRFRRKQERQKDLARHSPPGSKAGPRREFNQKLHDDLVGEQQDRIDGTYRAKALAARHPLDDPSLDYNSGDAMLDDIVGNAGRWTTQPTPEPIYYGDRQRALFDKVVHQLEVYEEEVKALPAGSPPPTHLLPSDQEISLAVRAFRDQNGTKQKPIGIAKALQHVLKDLKIPSTKVFGEYTYNALLTCCRTPKEGMRVFQLMHQQHHKTSPYSWAILIDIYAKVGDYAGCVRVMDEMYAEGHKPNLAAYTSLLAACYKVCNDGRIAHEIRAKAGQVGWEKWQELRIKGLDPDVMVYGAILRLCAARGRPEQCLNLLDEMAQFEVLPTTLCFSSALKAIARSHETAIRYERGSSKANRRREKIAAHHGKMANRVVLLAEQANVELDDGFISALQLCAAAAGDSATAKAIYLAYKVRLNMKHMRNVGGEDHLARLRGEDPENLQLEGRNSQLLQLGDGGRSGPSAVAKYGGKSKRKQMSFQEREYGQDGRTLSAMLKACAQACDSSGVGTMWSGRENYGYLDLTSLRLIQEQRKPQFQNTDIPGMSRTEVGVGNLVDVEDMRNPRKRTDPDIQKGKRTKYEGIVTDDDAVFTGLHDLPDDLAEEFFDEDGILKQKYIDTGKYPEYERLKESETRRYEQLDQATTLQLGAGDGETKMYYSEKEQKWIEGEPPEGMITEVATITQEDIDPADIPPGTHVELLDGGDEPLQLSAGENAEGEKPDGENWLERSQPGQAAGEPASAAEDSSPGFNEEGKEDKIAGEDWYFDDEAKTKAKGAKPEPTFTAFEAKALEAAKQNGVKYVEDAVYSSDEEEDEDEDNDDDDEEDFDEEAYERFLKAASETDVTDEGKFKDLALEKEFEDFFKYMKEEGDEELKTLDEVDARQFFILTRNEFQHSNQKEASSNNVPDLGELDVFTAQGNEPTGKNEKASMPEHAGEFGDPEAMAEAQYQEFVRHMKETTAEGDFDETEAREFFNSTMEGIMQQDGMQSERFDNGSEEGGSSDAFATPPSQPIVADNDDGMAAEGSLDSLPTMARGRSPPKKEFGEIMEELKDEWGEDGLELDGGDWSDDEIDSADDYSRRKNLPANDGSRLADMPRKLGGPEGTGKSSRTRVMEAFKEGNEDFDSSEELALSTQHAGSLAAQSVESFLKENPLPAPQEDVHVDAELQELRQLLPGLPDSRLRRVQNAYAADLSDPSLTELVPILRETSPDWYATRSLRAANLRNARFVMQKAEEAGLMSGSVGVHLLNGMMQVYTATGSIDNALALYEEYDKRNEKPNAYCERLVIQMFLKHRQLRRCLEFKQKIEERGRKADILAYGSMIEYCSKHRQLGSALTFLKECLKVHGAPPGDAYLKQLRILCRRSGLEEEVGLERMIGEDPIEWLRHGRATYLQNQSYKGPRNNQTNLARNALVR